MKEDEMVRLLSGETKTREEQEENGVKLSENRKNTELIIEYLHTQIDRLKEEIKDIEQDREQRKFFGYLIFCFVCLYMIAALILVYMQALHVGDLSDAVIITLLSSSLASVVGIFNFVAKYLFPSKKRT